MHLPRGFLFFLENSNAQLDIIIKINRCLHAITQDNLLPLSININMNPFAIYFPQFYPTPTNDEVWGKDFTDWILVANANLRNEWPRRAPEIGYYDGSDPKIHKYQIDQARLAGLAGFAVYHYWFYTHQELDAFEASLRSRQPDSAGLPWFLIWASEGWSKRWLGDSSSVVPLTNSPTQEEVESHCNYLVKCFECPEYFRLGDRPLFVVYHLAHFEYPERLIGQYKESFSRRGYDVAIAHFVKNPSDFQYCKFTDASYLFEPRLFFGFQKLTRGKRAEQAKRVIQRLAGDRTVDKLLVLMDRVQRTGNIHTASEFLQYMRSKERVSLSKGYDRPMQEVVSPGWNNTPRYAGRSTVLEPILPGDFGQLVSEAMAISRLPPLINAWNEWSEGAAIEPCAYRNREYLDQISFLTAGKNNV